MSTVENPVLFQRILAPLKTLLKEPEIAGMPDSALKLTFPRFVDLLLYLCLKGIDGLRSLCSELKNNPQNVALADLVVVGVSTISDAFARYPLVMVQKLYQRLLAQSSLPDIEEFRTLGQLAICDSSLFPIRLTAFWASYRQHVHALKLHLSFSLNSFLPICLLTANGKQDDRKGLRELLETGVTYIADRGYIAFDLLLAIVTHSAFFIIRSRKNLCYHVQQVLTVNLPPAVRWIFLAVTDEYVVFARDCQQQVYRRISFQTRQTQFILVTNRLDLTTYEIIKLYCLRWQVELFFRYFKQTMQAKHLLNLSEAGVAIHFYIVLMAHLLLVLFKYQQQQLWLYRQQELQQAREEQGKSQAAESAAFKCTEDFVAAIGKTIPSYLKIKKHERLAICNALLQTANQFQFAFT